MSDKRKKRQKTAADADAISPTAVDDDVVESVLAVVEQPPLLSAAELTKLDRILSADRRTLSKEDLRYAFDTLRACTEECDSLLKSKQYNPSAMEQWEENWTDALRKQIKNGYLNSNEDEIKSFVQTISESIVTPPVHVDYHVPAKHGAVIVYQLFAFETREEDGKTQKILAERYAFDMYNEYENWRLTSASEIAKSMSWQQHLKHIEGFRVPEELPPGPTDDLFWTDDEGLGLQTFYERSKEGSSGRNLTLKEVLETKAKWQIVTAMTTFPSLH